MVKKTPAYKNKLRALELERSGGVTNKKKSQKNMDKYVIILNLYVCICFKFCKIITLNMNMEI